MRHNGDHAANDLVKAAYGEGRRAGLATGALAVGVVAFLSLLGIEKAALSLTLAVLALRGAKLGSTARRLSWLAVLISSIYVVTYVTVLVLYRDKLAELVRLLQQLG